MISIGCTLSYLSQVALCGLTTAPKSLQLTSWHSIWSECHGQNANVWNATDFYVWGVWSLRGIQTLRVASPNHSHPKQPVGTEQIICVLSVLNSHSPNCRNYSKSFQALCHGCFVETKSYAFLDTAWKLKSNTSKRDHSHWVTYDKWCAERDFGVVNGKYSCCEPYGLQS